MNCPSCDHIIPDEAIVRAAASINGKKGKKGGAREGAGRPPKGPVDEYLATLRAGDKARGPAAQNR